MMSSSSSVFFPDQQLPSTNEKLCYVHCNCCDTVLAVSVPCSSLFKTVTVRCGHCTNLLSVNMRGLLFPTANQLQLGHNFFTPQNLLVLSSSCTAAFQLSSFGFPISVSGEHSSVPSLGGDWHEEMRNAPPNLPRNQNTSPEEPMMQLRGGMDPIHKPPTVNRSPEKRQRVPSAYNRFIKAEIQRIKAGNPDISHREAFSAAAKNWAHFPHIHFGLMPDDQPVKKPNLCQQHQQQQDGEDMMRKDGIYVPPPNFSVSP
ncbi:hypothetical protein MLD38_010899 [Melastoma candidum]|uniref:Uncharacterized protein n=1 Tax=Melastoma candidum TaxID=119954 RepID=A0ACB9R1D2_9MYRT|nr:hypothetical protein MLD38_010899 [Melastoma candidum]